MVCSAALRRRTRAEAVIAALRAERMRQGISQRRLGLSFYVAESAVGAWENHHVRPGAGLVRRWHVALGLPVPSAYRREWCAVRKVLAA